MATGFGGEVATYYAQHRRGYPPEVLDALAAAFQLGADDTVVDLGCGTGQLSLPLADRVGTVIGMDPEPDMLAIARRTALDQGIGNATWVLGSDGDVPALSRLVGERTVGALTVAVAIHFMDRDALFTAARPLLRPGGGIAVVTNGEPLWTQDTEWSAALRGCLERMLGRPVTGSCQTDEAGRRRNREALVGAGYRYEETSVRYDAPLTVDDMVGGVFSAMSAERLPSSRQRATFAADVRDALGGRTEVIENVWVWMQCGVCDEG
ncbi:class I SAM-dependent methyltransferase [Micromonospora aurantiaca (nom. illeg.)]|uniref:class I SAM-dependent methyltransferase n=1 Tax=Micromonospora aurantiaca (nom. illeg.) TaxID=47850 RepID=UPI0008293257|nr:class I SAM-dependent methyltransferase [Micromonospora aurantiaca]SCL26597.1 Methyltransferase domain-containing protein [Micromonospora aurantiaca]